MSTRCLPSKQHCCPGACNFIHSSTAQLFSTMCLLFPTTYFTSMFYIKNSIIFYLLAGPARKHLPVAVVQNVLSSVSLRFLMALQGRALVWFLSFHGFNQKWAVWVTPQHIDWRQNDPSPTLSSKKKKRREKKNPEHLLHCKLSELFFFFKSNIISQDISEIDQPKENSQQQGSINQLINLTMAN